ncbi:hypothetical protein [Nonomuraea wenchangensis]
MDFTKQQARVVDVWLTAHTGTACDRAAEREAYDNDLDEPWHLAAVTA